MWIPRLRSLLHSDFAFRQDTTLSALPLVIAFLTVLSICMTHSAAYIKHVTLNGSEALSQRLHLHLPYDTTDDDISALYDELATVEGVEMVERVSRADIQGLLSNWLNIEHSASDQYPLPVILDIFLHPEAQRTITHGQIDYYLERHHPDALLESYDDTIAAFNQSSQLIKTGVYILGFIVMGATTLIVVITSRINLGVHKQHIEILHHLGASDRYINRQFIKRAGLISLQGVIGGTLLSVLFIEIISGRIDGALFPATMGGGLQNMWIYYIVNPLFLMLLVMSASWVSIEAQLKKMH